MGFPSARALPSYARPCTDQGRKNNGGPRGCDLGAHSCGQCLETELFTGNDVASFQQRCKRRKQFACHLRGRRFYAGAYAGFEAQLRSWKAGCDEGIVKFEAHFDVDA